jgi:hypothetical protein
MKKSIHLNDALYASFAKHVQTGCGAGYFNYFLILLKKMPKKKKKKRKVGHTKQTGHSGSPNLANFFVNGT